VGEISRKNVLISAPGEGSFCNSERVHDRKTAFKPEQFVSTRRLQELTAQSQKLAWVRVPVKMLGLGVIFFFAAVFNDTYRSIKPTESFWAIMIGKKRKRLSDYHSVPLGEFY
jgi:hypothetical protein